VLRLALRNLFRQKLRTLMTLSAIVFGVVGLILSGGFIKDVFVQLGEALIHSQSGHLQIAKSGFHAQGAQRPEQYLIRDVAGIKRDITALKGVADVVARLGFSGLINNGRTDHAIIGEGVEPDSEAKIGSYMVMAAGRRLSDRDKDGIVIGQGVAHALRLQPGDAATLLLNTPDGALNTLEFTVVGVFRSFSKEYDARAVKIPLAAAQELLNTSSASTLVTVLHETGDTERIQQELNVRFSSQGFEVRNWIELNDFYEKTVQFYDTQFGVLRFIVLAMVLLSVMNSVNMTVTERVGEFGTLMALGNRSDYIFRLVLTESTLLGLFGALIGIAIGTALATIISAIGLPMASLPNSNLGYTAAIRLTMGLVLSAGFVGFVATVLASLLPALYVSRRPVVDALRQNV
jgi:putative ABC transport system permease protein